MGRQVSFFMTAEDEAAFVARARSLGAVIIPWTSKVGEFSALDPLPPTPPFQSEEDGWRVAIFAREDAALLKHRNSEVRGLWLVDTAHTIEFGRSLRGRGVITRGRIFLSQPESAGELTAQLFRKLESGVRKTGLKTPNGYLAAGAQAHHETGLHFWGSIPIRDFVCMACFKMATPGPPEDSGRASQ